MDTGANIGIIPVGTGNDFVRSAEIPDDANNALNTVITGYSNKD